MGKGAHRGREKQNGRRGQRASVTTLVKKTGELGGPRLADQTGFRGIHYRDRKPYRREVGELGNEERDVPMRLQ